MMALRVVIVAAMLMMAAGCSKDNDKKQAAKEPDADQPKAEVKQSQPAQTPSKAGQAVGDENEPEFADNSLCLTCHADYEMEELTINHMIEGIGCQVCHGESTAHKSDEKSMTAPDRMYTKEAINTYCMSCHADRDDMHKQAIKISVCTDCHGEHKRENRTGIWNKETGELINPEKK